MIADFHFLRPWWWLVLIPVLLLVWYLSRRKNRVEMLESICDRHLLTFLMQSKNNHTKYLNAWLPVLLSLLSFVIALTGPAWHRLPVPLWQPLNAHVLILDVSDLMMERDIQPDRLSRAKFILRDIFAKRGSGQFGMIAYTSEPFVVSPLTEDGHTIEDLLSSLTPDIMPVQGQNLTLALKEAQKLVEEAGFHQAEFLVLTAHAPSDNDIETAESLSSKGFHSSIIPMVSGQSINPLFKEFSKAGHGMLLSWSSATDLNLWIHVSGKKLEFGMNQENTVPVWKDEGRWFLLPALLFMLPVFRKGWLQKVSL